MGRRYTSIITSAVALFCTSTILSQQRVIDNERNYQSTRPYTLLERFEPELAFSASDRKQMKAERFAEIKLKMQIWDTMNISESKREKLLSDLLEKPLNTPISRNSVYNQFEEEK